MPLKAHVMRGMNANGDLIRDLRKVQGITQEQLAERAGLDVKTVRNAEQSKRLDLGSLTKLCFVLKAELRQLIVRPCRSARELEIARRDVVIHWQRAFNERDLDGLMRGYHDDAELHLPGEPLITFAGDFRGRKRIRRAAQVAWGHCRRQLLDQQDHAILVSDETVIVQGHMCLRSSTGEVRRLHYTQTFRFNGELIVDHRVEFDTLNFARLAQDSPADAQVDALELNPPRNPRTSR
jgi:transcriptional regulator with XRE-family HTH domain